jgi:hypothetical protein
MSARFWFAPFILAIGLVGAIVPLRRPAFATVTLTTEDTETTERLRLGVPGDLGGKQYLG